jgi:hypothetical protein
VSDNNEREDSTTFLVGTTFIVSYMSGVADLPVSSAWGTGHGFYRLEDED